MAIAGRHVRHDWQTFMDWEQKSVRTVCGRTTKRHLAGIPGITEQAVVIQAQDRKLSGWCQNCAVSVYSFTEGVLSNPDLTPALIPLYQSAKDETTTATEAYRKRYEEARWNGLAKHPARV